VSLNFTRCTLIYFCDSVHFAGLKFSLSTYNTSVVIILGAFYSSIFCSPIENCKQRAIELLGFHAVFTALET